MSEERIFYTYYQIIGPWIYFGKGKNDRYLSSVSKGRHYKFAFSKYGITECSIIKFHDSEQLAFAHERVLIAEARKNELKILNEANGGEGSAGFQHDEYSRKRISEGLRNRTPEQKLTTRQKLLKTINSKSEEQKLLIRKKQSTKLRGVRRFPLSETHKRKLSISHLGQIPPNKGVPKPKEEIRRRTKAWKKNKEKIIAKISQTLKGRPITPENIASRIKTYRSRTLEEKEAIRLKMIKAQRRRRKREKKVQK